MELLYRLLRAGADPDGRKSPEKNILTNFAATPLRGPDGVAHGSGQLLANHGRRSVGIATERGNVHDYLRRDLHECPATREERTKRGNGTPEVDRT